MVKTIIFVGERMVPLKRSLNKAEGRIVLICSELTYRKVKNLPYAKIIVDPYNIVEVADVIQKEGSKERNIIIDITGASKIAVIGVSLAVSLLSYSKCKICIRYLKRDGTFQELPPILDILFSGEATLSTRKKQKWRILEMLLKTPMTVTELSKTLGLKKSTVSDHIKKMRDDGLVMRCGEKRNAPYVASEIGKFVLEKLKYLNRYNICLPRR